MRFNNLGETVFDDVYELYYNLFNAIGLSINYDSKLYDQDSCKELLYNNHFIKAATTPIAIYAGKNDVIFDPYKNYNIMVMLFVYWLDKEAAMNDMNIGYLSQYIEDNKDTEDQKQRFVLKTNKGEYISKWYYNLWLGYAEIILAISDNIALDLSNLDIKMEIGAV